MAKLRMKMIDRVWTRLAQQRAATSEPSEARAFREQNQGFEENLTMQPKTKTPILGAGVQTVQNLVKARS
jgi:hypothetical protein